MDATWQFEVFYDRACPLCAKEIDFLRRRDRKEAIRFTDIADEGFRPDEYERSLDEFMTKIQGRDREGRWFEGVEVFRRLYTAVGFGPLVALSRVPGLSHGLDAAYRVFAKNRLRLTGRCSDDTCEIPGSAV